MQEVQYESKLTNELHSKLKCPLSVKDKKMGKIHAML